MKPSEPSVALHVVVVRCNEPIGRVIHQLGSLPNVVFTVMQKQTARCNLHPLPTLPTRGEMRIMPQNLGRECSGYLQFLYDEYDRLPALTAFLQWGAEMHMPFPLDVSLRALGNFTGGYMALSKNSFEGLWPAPCESRDQTKALNACAGHYWRMASTRRRTGGGKGGRPGSRDERGGDGSGERFGTMESSADAPSRFRFYANGMFAVARERVRAHPRSHYKLLLDRMLGRAPLACVGGVHRAFAPWANASGLVRAEADCLMLEKMWHIFFGENPTLAPPDTYNEWRFPPSYRDAYTGGRRIRAGRIRCAEQ